MAKAFFTGVCTALITPFLKDQINFPMVDRLIERQLEAGIPAILLNGTTGEAPTLSNTEKAEIVSRAKAFVGDDCKIIAGTGTNSTNHAIELSIQAESAGADAILVVGPYYNKGNTSGLIQHYTAIANSVKIPLIIYNVPSRTGCDIPIKVYEELSKEFRGKGRRVNEKLKLDRLVLQAVAHFERTPCKTLVLVVAGVRILADPVDVLLCPLDGIFLIAAYTISAAHRYEPFVAVELPAKFVILYRPLLPVDVLSIIE